MNWEEHITLNASEERAVALYFLSFYKNVDEKDRDKIAFAVEEVVKRLLIASSYNDILRIMRDEEAASMLPLKDVVSNILDMMDNAHGMPLKGATIRETVMSKSGEEYMKYLTGLLRENVKTTVREPAMFVSHCDDPSCDLGALHYMCLNCEKPSIDYDAWWKREDVMNGEEVQVDCYRCNEAMMMKKTDSGIWLKRVTSFVGTYADLKIE